MKSQLEKKYSILNNTLQKISRTWFLSNNVCSIRKLKWNYSIAKEDCHYTAYYIPWQNYCRDMCLLRRRFVKIFQLSPKTIFIPDCQYIISNTLHASVCGFLAFFMCSAHTIAYMNKFSFTMSSRACICGFAELYSFIPVYKVKQNKKK